MKLKEHLIEVKKNIEDFFLLIYNSIFSSKYIIKGKCKQCGNCCRNILFTQNGAYVKSKEVFQEMQKKYKYYRNFEISGVVQEKQDFQNGALTFKCKYISDKNKCRIYFFRPNFCRDYPDINPDLIYNGVEMLDGCGFYFDVNKKFKDYLEK